MEVKATVLGIVTGSVAKFGLDSSLLIAVLTALLTGAAAYAGNEIAKYIHSYFKYKKQDHEKF